MKSRQEVIKHSAAIHIQNNISLLQRRAWNVLLANAYDDLPEQDQYQISIHDLMQTLEFDSKNEDYLKESLRALATCGVEWDILDKDGDREWGITTLLAEALIKRGTCTYGYAPEMRKRLHNPKMYARISLSIQNKFSSKHAQALWELCIDYLDESRGYGETPWIKLTDFRKLMGIGPDEYPRFARLNERVIKEPIVEINKVTDCFVETEDPPKKEGRKVVAIKFKVRRALKLPGVATDQEELFPELKHTPLVYELKQLGFSEEQAWEIWQKGFEKVNPDKRPKGIPFDKYLQEKIDLLRHYKATSGIKRSSTGFLRRAIEENWSNPDLAEAQAKEAETQGQRDKEAKRKTLEHERTTLEKSRRSDSLQICDRLVDENPDILQPVVETMLDRDERFKNAYDERKTPVDNYQRTTFVRPWLAPEIERQHPEHFLSIQKNYDMRLREIEKQLSGTG